MYIPIEITVGSIAFGICPAEKGNGNTAIQNLIIARVLEIDNGVMGERKLKLETDIPKLIMTLPEWRISEFDFGGIPVRNVWFDQKKIEEEDTKILGFNPYDYVY